jgi:hypothetical protein
MATLLAIWLATTPGLASGADISIRQTDGLCEFLAGGRVVMGYHAAGVPKPFIDPLCTPKGHSVTTARSGQPHHHGLWLTWGGILAGDPLQIVQFWSESGDAAMGEVVLQPGTEPQVIEGDDSVALVTRSQWRRKSDGLLLLTERREVRLHAAGSPQATLITILSEQMAARDLVLSHQSNEAVSYYGLALQMPPDMSHGLVVNSLGDTGRAGVEGVHTPWCAYATNVAPARTVALFEDPTNPRFPNGWFTLPSGFLSVSLVANEDYALREGETLRLCYGAAAIDGDFDMALVRQLHARWRGAVSARG